MRVVAKHILGDQIVELNDAFIIEFGDGETKIAVSIHQGNIDVRSPNGNRISVQPRASNSVYVSAIT